MYVCMYVSIPIVAPFQTKDTTGFPESAHPDSLSTITSGRKRSQRLACSDLHADLCAQEPFHVIHPTWNPRTRSCIPPCFGDTTHKTRTWLANQQIGVPHFNASHHDTVPKRHLIPLVNFTGRAQAGAHRAKGEDPGYPKDYPCRVPLTPYHHQ
jgi:hypothetical protein